MKALSKATGGMLTAEGGRVPLIHQAVLKRVAHAAAEGLAGDEESLLQVSGIGDKTCIAFGPLLMALIR